MAHKLARAFAVATVDFLVMQKIMIGLFCECFAIISGSLRDVSDVLRYHKIHMADFGSQAFSNPKSFPV